MNNILINEVLKFLAPIPSDTTHAIYIVHPFDLPTSKPPNPSYLTKMPLDKISVKWMMKSPHGSNTAEATEQREQKSNPCDKNQQKSAHTSLFKQRDDSDICVVFHLAQVFVKIFNSTKLVTLLLLPIPLLHSPI